MISLRPSKMIFVSVYTSLLANRYCTSLDGPFLFTVPGDRCCHFVIHVPFIGICLDREFSHRYLHFGFHGREINDVFFLPSSNENSLSDAFHLCTASEDGRVKLLRCSASIGTSLSPGD